MDLWWLLCASPVFSIGCFQVVLHHLVCLRYHLDNNDIDYVPLGYDWQDSFHLKWKQLKVTNLHVHCNIYRNPHLGWINKITTPADHNQCQGCGWLLTNDYDYTLIMRRRLWLRLHTKFHDYDYDYSPTIMIVILVTLFKYPLCNDKYKNHYINSHRTFRSKYSLQLNCLSTGVLDAGICKYLQASTAISGNRFLFVFQKEMCL